MFDLAIIGGGPAGYSAAFEAIRHKMSVVLFEKQMLGGTCLNKGCVPTKYLTHVARQYYEMQYKMFNGILAESVSLDYKITKERMDEIIHSLRSGLEEELNRKGVLVVNGTAIIVKNNLIECNEQSYEAENILISTGSEPMPSFIDGGINSDDILELDNLPTHVSIIGGGIVAVEYAEILKMFGVDVDVYIRGDRILRKWDKEISIGLSQSMKKKGITINKRYDFSRFTKSKEDVVLSALGRRPVLPPTECKIFEIGEKGGIVIDKNGQTLTDGVFAAGDVVEGSHLLAHTAMEQGRNIVKFIYDGTIAEEKCIISCIYTDQESATVGLTEEEARKKELGIVVAKHTMFSNARTRISIDERGFIKLIADKNKHTLIGAQLICEHAGELVSEIALAINQELLVEDMVKSIRPHPSYCEVITEVLRELEGKLCEV